MGKPGEKQRLDLLLVERSLAESRQKAQALIMAGQVYVKQQKVTKAGANISQEDYDTVEVRGKTLPYVSRGGLKLEKAIQCWDLNLQGQICGDIGASTGGFTDCMLQQGAAFVYAVDSGYNQLDWKLRSHPQVCSMERCNARHLTPQDIPQPLDFFSVDVSFISLRLILPPLLPLLKPEGQGVCLIKPQFEAGRGQVGKKGVVRDPQVHRAVLEAFLSHSQDSGFAVQAMTFSPIKGPEGNVEYLAHLRPATPDTHPIPQDCQALVTQSHQAWKEADCHEGAT